MSTCSAKPADGYWSDVWLKAPWCAVYWNGRPTVDWMLTSTYISSSPWNSTYFKNETFDNLLVAARAEVDEDKRREMYHEVQRLLYEEGGVTVLAFVNILIAASDKLGHDGVGASRRLDDSPLGPALVVPGLRQEYRQSGGGVSGPRRTRYPGASAPFSRASARQCTIRSIRSAKSKRSNIAGFRWPTASAWRRAFGCREPARQFRPSLNTFPTARVIWFAHATSVTIPTSRPTGLPAFGSTCAVQATSEGHMPDMYCESERDDIRQAIGWIAEQDWCDGKVGMFGTSWGGTASLQAACDKPDALKGRDRRLCDP